MPGCARRVGPLPARVPTSSGAGIIKAVEFAVSMTVARLIATFLEAYAAVGVLFAAAFLPRSVLRLDPRLARSPVSVRLLILPGVAALWPLFLRRWLASTPEPVERNAHRRAAERSR